LACKGEERLCVWILLTTKALDETWIDLAAYPDDFGLAHKTGYGCGADGNGHLDVHIEGLSSCMGALVLMTCTWG